MRASFVWATVAVLLPGCLPGSDDQREAVPPAPRSGPVGTVETLAGPGHCPGASVRDRSSEEVGALALDREGRIFFEAGPADDGFVARVEPDGRLAKIRHLTARGPYQQNPNRPAAPAAGRLATDEAGGVFLAAGSKVVHLDSRGALFNIAGDPKHPPSAKGAASSGDGGPAADARFSSARSVIADEAGNLYIADALVDQSPQVRVRFVNRTAAPVTFYDGTPLSITVQPGHIATIAGGAGGQGSKPATFPGEFAAFALSGTRLYMATSSAGAGLSRPDSVLRLVNLSGGPLAAHGVSVEPGMSATLLPQKAPGGGRPKGGGGGPALSGPITAMAADSAGNAYLAGATDHRVIRINAAGSREHFAGARARGRGGFNGNDRQAAGAWLDSPFSLAVGKSDRVYISDQRNGQIRFVDQSGVIRATPGAGFGLKWTCPKPRPDQASPRATPAARSDPSSGGSEDSPRQGGPARVVSDEAGTTYFTNSLGHQVKKVDLSGRIMNIAGDGRAGDCARGSAVKAGGRSRPIAQAGLRNPGALALASGGIYVADCDNSRISFLNLRSERVRINGVEAPPRSMITVAGSGTPGFGGDGKRAVDAQLGGSTASRLPLVAHPALEDAETLPPDVSLGALAADGRGNLYVADTGNGRVRRINLKGIISTVAGEGMPGPIGDCCKRPIGLAVDGLANLYVLDAATLRVWFVNLGRLPLAVKGVQAAAGSAAPVAGNGAVGFAGEGGRASEAELAFPMGIALDKKGNLYIVEVGAALGRTLFDPIIRGVDVRKVDTRGVMRTVLGPGLVGFNGDGLKPNLTSLSFPTGIGVDRCGNLLIADLGSDRLRRVNLEKSCQG
ncbi:MAG: hypothetical protein ACR2M4_04530 [Actinomycetota bacterium]